MIKAVVFDLDGTLLDTIGDIASSCNQVLEKLGYDALPETIYKIYVGEGVIRLVERLFEHYQINQTLFDQFVKDYYAIYKTEAVVRTKPYDGILELLNKINQLGVSVNILSNKPDIQVQAILPIYFNPSPFQIALGKQEGYPIKPNPKSLNEIIERLDVDKDEVLYVGDTKTDIHTANNAGVKSVGVLWGFRDEAELAQAGASFIISKPSQIIEIINRLK